MKSYSYILKGSVKSMQHIRLCEIHCYAGPQNSLYISTSYSKEFESQIKGGTYFVPFVCVAANLIIFDIPALNKVVFCKENASLSTEVLT